MKTLISTFLILLVPAAHKLDANPILNGDFEKEDQGSMAWWAGRCLPAKLPNTTTGSEDLVFRYVWDTQSHGSGKGSLRIDCKGIQEGEPKKDVASGALVGGGTNETLVKPDTEYKLTWFWKAKGLSAKSTASVVVMAQSAGPVDVPPKGSKFLKQYALDLKSDSPEWKQETLTFKTPPDAGWIQVRVNLSGAEPRKKFSVWLDDIELTRADGSELPEAAQVPKTWTGRGELKAVDSFGTPGFTLNPPPQPYGSRIQRTMNLLATSTPERRNRVKILFYGQSIIGQNWWKNIVADLRDRFPNADIHAENPSIGGFMSDMLKDTMYGDCYPSNADLICFHDYGRTDGSMEEMFANMRKLTTAEVVAFTHHVMAQRAWDKGQTADSELILHLGKTHGFETVDIRPNWKKYEEVTQTKDSDFLKDGVHLNAAGETLWWKITEPHLQHRPEGNMYWHDWIKVYTSEGKPFTADARTPYPTTSSLLSKPLKLNFEGNRIDLLASAAVGQKLGTARILIDGKAPSSFPELYYATRGSRPPNFFQPMLRRAQIGKDPVPETWTLTFKGISPTGQDFTYEAKGSVTGPDGTGNAKEKFVSNSGRIIIEPSWFLMQVLVEKISKGKPYPDGTTCTFEVRPNFIDVWKPQAPSASAKSPGGASLWTGFGTALTPTESPASEQRYTLASGLSNGPHTLEIIPNGDGDLPLRAIVVHRPPAVPDQAAVAAPETVSK